MTEQKKSVDWLLIIFLLLFTNQAIFSIKLAGLAFMYLFRFNWKFGFGKGRLPKFYPYIIVLSLITFLFITREFTQEYIAAFITGNMFWVFSLLAAHQTRLSVDKFGKEGVTNTIRVYTVINFIVCLAQLGWLMSITHTINPYNEKVPFPYGVSSGDFIFGAFLEMSYYNTMVSSLLAIYFIYKRDILFTVLNTVCFVMVFGNFGTIVIMVILLGMLLIGIIASVVKHNYDIPFARYIQHIAPPGKYYIYIPAIFIFIVSIYYSASPKNWEYLVSKFKDKIFLTKKSDEHNYATIIENQKPEEKAFDSYSDFYKRKEEELSRMLTTSLKPLEADASGLKLDAKVMLTQSYFLKLQGKNLSMLETRAHLKSSATAFLFGAGTARFSSLTAQKMSGFDSSRLFMDILPKYKSELYSENHFLILEEREKTKDYALLSTANRPDSLYNQLFGEYGVIGFLLFVIFYLGFFLKNWRQLTYGIWLIGILLPFAHLIYVFDTLCAIPFFELLMFADMPDKNQTNHDG